MIGGNDLQSDNKQKINCGIIVGLFIVGLLVVAIHLCHCASKRMNNEKFYVPPYQKIWGGMPNRYTCHDDQEIVEIIHGGVSPPHGMTWCQ